MILECPECKARYAIPDHAIGAAGRTVRCAKCAHSWFQAPPEGYVAPKADALEKMIEDINARATPQPVPPGSNLPAVKNTIPIGLKASTYATAAVATLLLIFMLFPSWFGARQSEGLELADVTVTKLPAGDQAFTYKLSGKIHNKTDHEMHMPVLRITLVDAAGRPLQYWDYGNTDRIIDKDQASPFSTDNMEVTFSSASHFMVEIGSGYELALRRKPSISAHRGS